MWILLIIACLLAAWFYMLYKSGLGIRMALISYIILLLFDEEVLNDHREKIKVFIKESKSTDANSLSLSAHQAIQSMAEGLEDTSIMGAHATIWEEKKKSS